MLRSTLHALEGINRLGSVECLPFTWPELPNQVQGHPQQVPPTGSYLKRHPWKLSCRAILGMFLLQGTGWVTLLTLWAIINASGAIGDLWMVSIVLRYPKTVYVVDEKDGFRVFTRVTVCNDTLVA